MHEAKGPVWLQRLTAPLQLGSRDLVPTLAKLGGALTMNALQKQSAKHLASSLMVNYDKALAVLTSAARCGS